MSPAPSLLARLLARHLQGDPAGPAILGDLQEDMARIARERGSRAARRWYRREAALLLLDRWLHALIHPSLHGTHAMRDLIRLRGFRHDAAAALRVVRQDPGLFAMLALVVGLGVGATTAVYSVLRPLLVAPLPVAAPERLVWIEYTGGGNSLSSVTSRTSNLRDFRTLNRSFTGMAGYNAFSMQSAYTLAAGEGGPAERLSGVGVTDGFLEVLGVEPALGRGFTAEETAEGGPAAAVLGHAFWMRRFGGDAGVVGRSISLNGVATTVVGVLPPTFDFASLFMPGTGVDFLLPFPVSDRTDGWGNTIFQVARLREGVTLAAAQEDLDRMVAVLESEDPERWGLGARATMLQEHVAGPIRPALLLLVAAAAVVMLIVCFNVANVLLARSPKRAREVAVRKALGATRGRVLRQLLLESLMLCLPGALVGVGLAVLATGLVTGASAFDVPLLDQAAVEGSALLVAVLTALVAGLAAGLAPALQVAEGGEAAALRTTARGGSEHRAARRLREVLVVGELAAACLLLVAGGLLLRSFQEVTSLDLGFEPEGLVAWQLNPDRDFESNGEMIAWYGALTARVAAVPGVESVGLNDALPLGRNRTWGYRVVGVPPEEDTNDAFFPHMVDPGYLTTMGIDVVRGRGITPADTREAPRVLLVNETAAERMFAGEEALHGQVIAGVDEEPWEIVGIVEDVRHVTPEQEAGLQIYFPMAQLADFTSADMVVRTSLPPGTVAPAVSAALAQMAPGMPTREYWTMAERVDRSLSTRRLTLELLGGFGGLALVLAALGIYGVLAHTVAERRREIAIRMALGASPGSVRWAVVAQTVGLASLGIALGLLLALPGTRLLASLLYGVQALDPGTLATMGGTLLVVALLSGVVPAIKASRADALAALRSE